MTEALVQAGPRLEAYGNEAALTEAAVEIVSAQLAEGVEARGEAGMALAGGATPSCLYRRLAETDLPWSQVLVTPTDERWVDADSPESNERLLRTTLLTGRAAEARLVPLKAGRPTPETAAQAASFALAAATWPLDLVLLGMGDDAHFASLFPGNPALKAGLDRAAPLCIAVPAGAPAPPQPRLSLTL